MSARRWEISLALQAALIVLPVATLSAVALHFLREDRAAIEQDARDRAAAIVPALARQVGEAASVIFRAAASAIPPDYPPLPQPAPWPAALSAADSAQWKAAQDLLLRGQDPAPALAALSATGAGTTFLRANSQLLMLQFAPSVPRAVETARQSDGEVTAAGTSVAALALLEALRLPHNGDLPADLVQEIEQNTLRGPSFLSSELLDAAAHAATTDRDRQQIAAMQQTWSQQETARERSHARLRELAPQLHDRTTAAEIWLSADDPILALWAPETRRSAFLPRETVRRAFASAHPDLPGYVGATIEIGGQSVRIAGSPHDSAPRPLAQASSAIDAHPFHLTLDLADPDLLFAPYHRRLLLTEALVFSSAATALIGLFSLWQSHRRQEHLSQMKSNFVSSVSHELRAPIAAMRLMAESLETGRVSDPARRHDYYHLIVQECRRLSSLVENVLDFARIDQDRKQYQFAPVDAAALLNHVAMLMEPCAAERNVTLAVDAPAFAVDDAHPNWDAEAVEQSLVNLVDNAIKHSPAGAEVRLSLEAADGAALRYWVADHGGGIPPAEHDRIFEWFYRRGSELRRETAGVGIGLSIVKHVAEAHGGRVLVESEAGQGSRFCLELPLENHHGNGRANSHR